jgi:hypothetical protein
MQYELVDIEKVPGARGGVSGGSRRRRGGACQGRSVSRPGVQNAGGWRVSRRRPESGGRGRRAGSDAPSPAREESSLVKPSQTSSNQKRVFFYFGRAAAKIIKRKIGKAKISARGMEKNKDRSATNPTKSDLIGPKNEKAKGTVDLSNEFHGYIRKA